MNGTGAPRPAPVPTSFWATSAHLALLWSLAVAQPLYEVLGRHAELFVARRSPPAHVALLVVLLTLVAPALLVAATAVARRAGLRVAGALVTTSIGVLAAAAVLPAANRLLPATVPAVGLALAAGVAAALGYRRWAGFRGFLTALSPAVLVFPAVFLVATPVSRVAFPGAGPVAGPGLGWGDVPVVVVVFDLFPLTTILDAEGGIDAVRNPSFARLAAESVWLRQAKTVAIHTTTAVPALLTGRRAPKGALPVVEDHPDNLFTLLGPRARLRAFESMTWLCPRRLCGETGDLAPPRFDELLRDVGIVYLHVLLPPGLLTRVPAIDQGWYGFGRVAGEGSGEEDGEAGDEAGDEDGGGRLAGAARQARLAALEKERRKMRREDREAKLEAFLAALPEAPVRSLSYLHLNLPHTPFVFLPSGRRYVDAADPDAKELETVPGEAREPGDPRWSEDPDLVGLAYRRHLLQTGFADRVLGRVLDRLEELGLFDPALVVVAADHGRSYEPGAPRRSLEDGDTLHVPLFVKVPYQRRGLIDDRPADLRDVLPTVASLLGVEVPWTVEGRALLDPERVARARTPPGALDDAGPDRLPVASWPSPLLVSRLRRKLERVGAGDPRPLFAAGPAAELVGLEMKRAAERGVVVDRERDGVEATLRRADLLSRVDPASGFVPAYLLGKVRVTNGAPPPRDVVIAIDGVVRASCRTFEGGTRFAALLPEEALSAGGHRWTVFAAERDGDAAPWRLVELARGGRREPAR